MTSTLPPLDTSILSAVCNWLGLLAMLGSLTV